MGWVRFCQGLLASMVISALIGWSMLDRLPECTDAAEARRELDPASQTDLQHLDEDLARVAETAVMFGKAVGRMAIVSDSPDAIEGRRDMPSRAQAWCESALLDAVATTHVIDRAYLGSRLHKSTQKVLSTGEAF